MTEESMDTPVYDCRLGILTPDGNHVQDDRGEDAKKFTRPRQTEPAAQHRSGTYPVILAAGTVGLTGGEVGGLQVKTVRTPESAGGRAVQGETKTDAGARQARPGKARQGTSDAKTVPIGLGSDND